VDVVIECPSYNNLGIIIVCALLLNCFIVSTYSVCSAVIEVYLRKEVDIAEKQCVGQYMSLWSFNGWIIEVVRNVRNWTTSHSRIREKEPLGAE